MGGGISLFHSILVQRLEKPHSVYCTDILALVISLVPRPRSQFSEQRHETTFNYSVPLIFVTFLTVAWTLFKVDMFGVLEPPTGGPRLTKGLAGHSGD